MYSIHAAAIPFTSAQPDRERRARLIDDGKLGRLLAARAWVAVVLALLASIAGLEAANPPPPSPPPTGNSAVNTPEGSKPPSLSADKADYAPGTPATLTGHGFQPGEIVMVRVLHADGTPSTGRDHQPWPTLADALGNVRTAWHVCEDDCVGSELEATAVGNTSKAKASTRFKDSSALNLRVGYYDMTIGQGSSSQVAPIVTAGHVPVALTDLTAASLCGLDVLFVQNENNSGYGQGYVSHLPEINAAVAAGMVLILHDRYVDAAESILPGAGGLDIRLDFSDPANIQVLDNSTVLTSGPGGTIDNGTLDGGCSSSHGYAVAGSLPPGAVALLSRSDPSQIVTFAYPVGSGWVIYSSIPLDFYLQGFSCEAVPGAFRTIYAPNVVAYGGVLSTGRTDNSDADGDGVPDCLDSCPTMANPDQANQVACISLTPGGTCLEAKIELSHGLPDYTGDVSILGVTPGMPTSLTFEYLATCGSDQLEFYLNGGLIGQAPGNATFSCSCDAPLQTFTVADPDLIADRWLVAGNNTFRVVKSGFGTAFAWARVRLSANGGSQTFCFSDTFSGSCDVLNLCSAGYTFDPVDASQTLVDPFIPPVRSAHYQDSLLPAHLDLTGLADGDYTLCVSGVRPGQSEGRDCVSFTKAGETRIVINGPGQCVEVPNRSPVAKCRSVTAAAGVSCTAAASIDNGSYDPDGDAMTITQSPAGPYSIGTTFVELTVTDSHGLSSSCQALVTVFGPPVACIILSAEATCLDALIQLSPNVQIGDVFVRDAFNTEVATVHFEDALLPPHLDITSLADGNYTLCVGGNFQENCASFTKAGQSRIVINGPGQCAEPPNRPPVARCRYVSLPVAADCSGVDVSVDNGSYDPDGDTITLTQSPTGPYPIGVTPVVLTVTDSHGAVATCQGYVEVLGPNVACINLTPGGSCLDAAIALSRSDFTGDVYVPGTLSAIPGSLVFETLSTSFGSGDVIQFYLNGTPLGQTTIGLNGGIGFNWCPAPETFVVNNAALIAQAWQVDGNNTLQFVLNGSSTYLGWVRVRFPAGSNLGTVCLGSFSFLGCDETCLYSGYTQSADVSATIGAPFIPAAALAHYQDSLLPAHLDISGLPNGNYSLCISGAAPFQTTPQTDCRAFTKAGESTIIINGPGQCQEPPNRPPVAKCHDVFVDSAGACAVPASVDAGSYDPDGNAITVTQDPPGPYAPGTTFVQLTVTDSGGLSSVCGALVTVAGPAVACLQVVDGGLCLDASINLTQPDFTGAVEVFGTTPGTPTRLVFEMFSTTCGFGDTFDFYLNDTFLGEVAADPTAGCTCTPPVQNFIVNDAGLIAAHWNVSGNNNFRFQKNGFANLFGWVRVSAQLGNYSQTFSIYDVSGGNSTRLFLCDAYRTDFIDVSRVVAEPFIPPTLTVGYQDSLLPARIDLVNLPDGAYTLCVSGARPFETSAQRNCVGFTKDGETQIIINGPGGCVAGANRPPVAKCHNVSVTAVGCVGTASIDNGSYDPDGDPVTFAQSPPGPYPLGTTTVELTVTDALGLSSSCVAQVEVVDRPTLHCPQNILVGNDAGQASAVVNLSVTADSCSPVVVSCDPPTGSSFPVGVTTVTCNALSGVFTVGTPGALRFEYFDNITGNSLGDLVRDARYLADTPTATYSLSAFDTRTAFPDDSHENYGGRISGLFIPPTSGNWIFYLRSDDNSQLYLNPTGASPAGKVKLQEESTCCRPFSAHASAPKALVAGQAYFIEALYKEGTFGDYCQVAAQLDTDPTPPDFLPPIPGEFLATLADYHQTYCSFTVTVEDREPPHLTCPANVNLTLAKGACAQVVNFSPTVTDNRDGRVLSGVVLQELYFDIPGVVLDDLRASPKFPNAPDVLRFRTSIEANLFDEYDNYGTRLSGVILPPVSGNYVFSLASDDQGEFWLSTDETPGNLVRLATEPTWTTRRHYLGEADGGGRGNPPSNVSAPISLSAGHQYYFEALMKEGIGGDHVAVAWQTPGGPATVDGDPAIGGSAVGVLTTQPVTACVPPSGTAFTVGTTTVNCTSTDAAGNSSSCSFSVTIRSSICGQVYYDANANAVNDDNHGLAGWKVTLTGSDANGAVGPLTQYTDAGGNYCFSLKPGSYTVTSVPPTTKWVNTTAKTKAVTLTAGGCGSVVDFGNVCVQPPAGGFTLGYWGNKNGEAILSANDPAWRAVVNSCNLVTSNGASYTVPAGNFKTAYGSFSSFLSGAKAVNMANMLSAQLAATSLDVQYQGLRDSVGLIVPACLVTSSGSNVVKVLQLPLVPAPLGTPACAGNNCAAANGYISVGALRAAAKASLAANPNTTQVGPARTYQECLKVLLDQVNNNGNPPAPSNYNCPLTSTISSRTESCPYTTPY